MATSSTDEYTNDDIYKKLLEIEERVKNLEDKSNSDSSSSGLIKL